LIDENAAPSPNPDVDFTSLSPTAEQYFLLSRLDGKLTVAELCKISGLGRRKTLESLELLARADAIDIPGYEAPSNPGPDASLDSAATTPTGASGVGKARKAASKVIPNYPVSPEDFEFDAALLALETPLSDDLRRQLICLHEQLEQMSFYDLFGLSPDASRKDIKKAYFRLSKRYHPDKFFRQDLGALGSMMETVFKEITRAYKILSKKQSRESYDAALAAHMPDTVQIDSGSGAGGAVERTPTPSSDPAERNKRKAVGALLMRRAEKLKSRGEFSRAAGEYRKALALTRDSHLAMTVASMLLQDAQMPEEAGSFARAALKLGADESSARFLLGRALEAQGAARAAVDEYRKVLADAPKHPGAVARLNELGEKL
jgi:curved DNA-binding protein CbpA